MPPGQLAEDAASGVGGALRDRDGKWNSASAVARVIVRHLVGGHSLEQGLEGRLRERGVRVRVVGLAGDVVIDAGQLELLPPLLADLVLSRRKPRHDPI